MKKITTIFFVLAVLMLIPVAYAAVSTTTQVNFNVDTVVGYTLTLLGESAVTANSTGAATTAIKFDSSTGTDSNVNAVVQGGSTQSDGNPIFQFDNTGTVDLNLSVALDTVVPGCMTLKGATSYAGADSGTTIGTSEVTVVNDFAPSASAKDWYMKADFSSCVSADTTSRSLTTTGVQS